VRVLLGFVLGVLLGFAATAAEAGERVALVLSAQSYQFLRPLDNPDHDAQAVADALRKLGFDVTIEQDRSLKKMRRALEDFQEEASGADVAVVYYAGHGVEIAGKNHLLPIDADASSLEKLKETSLPLEEVREAAAAVAPTLLIILDACRNDPFDEGAAAGGRSAKPLGTDVKAAVKPGLGRIGEARNTLFVFSAAPGQTAADGDGANSPFSAALAKYLPTEGLEIRSVLALVQQDVYDSSRGTQSPWVESAPFPSLFFAAETGAIPERERLLLAMADVTPELRDEVERVAAQTDVPLAPLYGALIGADLANLSLEDREKKLTESALAYVDTQAKLKALSSADPEVTKLRAQAEQSLAIGAFVEARKTLASAAEIDAQSGNALAANLVERRVSEAATRVAEAGIAHTQLDYPAAIAALEQAATLHAKIEDEDVPDAARSYRDRLLAGLGDLRFLVGDTAGALEAYERMGAAAKRRMAASAGEPDAERDLSDSLIRIGEVKVAQGDLAGALQAYSDSLAIAEKLTARDAGNAGRQRDLSINWDRIGDVKVAQGDLAGALQAYSDSLANSEKLAARDAGNADWQRDLSVSWQKIGNVKLAQGDLAGAVQAYSDGLAIDETLAARDAGNADRQRDLAVIWAKIGDVRMAQDDLAGAAEAYLDGLDIAEKLAARDEGNVGLQRDLSVSLSRIGGVKLALNDLTGALQAYSDSLAIGQKLAARDLGNVNWQRDLSVSWNKIGDVKVAQDDSAGALEAYSESLAIRERLAARDEGNADWQRDLSVSWEKIGDIRLEQGDIAGALQAYSADLALSEKLAARDDSNADWQRDLIVAHYKLGQAGEDPRLHYTKALEIAEAMDEKGILSPSDAFIPDMLREELANLQ